MYGRLLNCHKRAPKPSASVASAPSTMGIDGCVAPPEAVNQLFRYAQLTLLSADGLCSMLAIIILPIAATAPIIFYAHIQTYIHKHLDQSRLTRSKQASGAWRILDINSMHAVTGELTGIVRFHLEDFQRTGNVDCLELPLIFLFMGRFLCSAVGCNKKTEGYLVKKKSRSNLSVIYICSNNPVNEFTS